MIRHMLFEYLVNSLWQFPLLVGASWLLIRLARPALAVQHALWLATVILAVALPGRGLDWNAKPETAPTAPVATEIVRPLPLPATEPHGFRGEMGALRTLHVRSLRLNDRTIDWLVELYAISIAFSLARLVHGYVTVRKLTASATERPLTTLESILLDACAKQVHLAADRIPKVRFFDDPGMTPMVIGILDPVLLLPTSMRHTTEREFNDLDLMAIFAHELTHVRRRDYLINLTARLLSLPVAYHPVSRALHARMRQAQEMICDASAAGAFDSKCSYARSLLAVADRIVQPFSSIEAPTLFNSARNTLEERIMNLTTEHQPIHFSLRLARVTAGAAILILAVGTTASLHIRSAAHLDGSARVVYAAQIQQAPQPMPAPASAPAAAAEPKPQTSSQGVIRHPVRDLDPEQRATMERNMAEARDQVRKATEQLNDPAFKRQLSEGITLANSAEFKKQMADLKIQLKQLDSPEFRQQILGAQKAIKLPDIKVDLENLKVQLNSPEFKSEIENAKLHALQAQANADQRNAETLKRLDEAAAAVAEARRKVNDANVQEQLDNAQKSIWEAAKNMR